MQFEQISYQQSRNVQGQNCCYLITDNWDDFGFKTTFGVVLFDGDGTRYDLGSVKIGRSGMEGGYAEIPDRFERLSENYFSLGQDQNYYEVLAEIDEDARVEYLAGLRDCVYSQEIWRQFRNQEVMRTSLLRSVSSRLVENNFPALLRGFAHLTPYHFQFISSESDGDSFVINIKVEPDSKPPTNVHILIGRNGVGKTRLLAGIAQALIEHEQENSYGLPGSINFLDEDPDAGKFASLVVVSFSAFDRFAPLTSTAFDRIRYSYVGLKKILRVENINEDGDESGSIDDTDHQETEISFKRPSDLKSDFDEALRVCLTGPRRRRWREIMETLGSDPGFAELGLHELPEEIDDQLITRILDAFDILSSGHKIVLLTATKLVASVDERSLVLIDEPESHLHPPLLGSFVRSLSDLLIRRNGVAIIATHSPVVLQEAPMSCVTVLRRSGARLIAEPPSIETFAENVGVLTREVFGLELTESGYHALLAEEAEDSSYEDVLEEFGGQIGGEGRAIVRALTLRVEDD